MCRTKALKAPGEQFLSFSFFFRFVELVSFGVV